MNRRSILIGIIGVAASALLAACGGSGTGLTATVATAPTAPTHTTATVRNATAPPGGSEATSVAASTYVAVSLATMNANARPTSGGVDPCTLVTQAEAAAAIGVPVTAPARSDSFGGGATTGEMESVCIYGDILSFTTPRLTITVGQKDPSHADNWSATRYWGREKDNHPSFLEPVANLGDEAMKRASDPKERVIIYVLKQDVVFNIDVQNTTAPLEDALGLATKAVRRLP